MHYPGSFRSLPDCHDTSLSLSGARRTPGYDGTLAIPSVTIVLYAQVMWYIARTTHGPGSATGKLADWLAKFA